MKLEKKLDGGFNFGTIEISGFDQFREQKLVIDYQNENLIAYLEREGSTEREVVATVPDLICVVGSERYECILTEDLRYGLRVSVIIVPAHPLLTTERAL